MMAKHDYFGIHAVGIQDMSHSMGKNASLYARLLKVYQITIILNKSILISTIMRIMITKEYIKF